MEFRTRVDIPVSDLRIDHSTRIMIFGSCFSSHIGLKMQQYKFLADVNPFGILFNPSSISIAVKRLLSGQGFTEDDLVRHQGLYHSFMHHGDFSSPDKQACIDGISARFRNASNAQRETDLLLVTFGSAYVYRRKDSGAVVANCHKFPGNEFHHTRLSVASIVDEWSELIHMLIEERPAIKVMFTVSPVRHWRDGARENQVSKSILHVAIDELQKRFEEHVCYFPAYEIVLDELRDYRFYDDDMLHPATVSVEYIWQRFSDTFFNRRTIAINEEWGSIRKSLEHRPIYPDKESYRLFLENTLSKLKSFEQKYPFISCEEEISMLNSKLDS